jgi:Exostosin family
MQSRLKIVLVVVLFGTFLQVVLEFHFSKPFDLALPGASTDATSDVITKVPVSLIHDQTIHWDPEVNRMWLNPNLISSAAQTNSQSRRLPVSSAPPPAMLLLTNVGWNQIDQEAALRDYGRRIRETELMQGVINHPWFHPTAWEEYESSPPNNSTTDALHSNRTFLQYLIDNTTTRFYVFLDCSTCEELNYPIYGGHDANLDTTAGRVGEARGYAHYLWIIGHPVWQSRWLQTVPRDRIKVIFFDCSGFGPIPGFRTNRFNMTRGLPTYDLPLALVSLSSAITNIDPSIDQGLIPPSPLKDPLTEQQIEDIYTCAAETNRSFFVTYTGNLRNGYNPRFGARLRFYDMHDNKDILIRRYFDPEYKESILANWTYTKLLANSVFSLAPRGDNKFSYKFTEVLSRGAIPVVLADDWMYPFRPELVDWSECVVILPEKYAGEAAIEVLRSISPEQRCQMRQRCMDIYRNYVESSEGTVNGIVQGLELVAQGHRKPMVGVKCILGQGVWSDEQGWWIRASVNATEEPDVENCNMERR